MRANVLTPPHSLEEFLSLPEGPPYYQLINGKIIEMASPIEIHQYFLTLLAHYLTTYILAKKIGRVYVAPFDVFFDEQNVYQPDLIYISKERYEQFIGSDGKLHGAPEWVAEILSPSTEKLDRNEKKEVYFRSGVQEYWLIDPLKNSVEVYIRGNNNFILNQIITNKGKINSFLLSDWEIYAENIFQN